MLPHLDSGGNSICQIENGILSGILMRLAILLSLFEILKYIDFVLFGGGVRVVQGAPSIAVLRVGIILKGRRIYEIQSDNNIHKVFVVRIPLNTISHEDDDKVSTYCNSNNNRNCSRR